MGNKWYIVVNMRNEFEIDGVMAIIRLATNHGKGLCTHHSKGLCKGAWSRVKLQIALMTYWQISKKRKNKKIRKRIRKDNLEVKGFMGRMNKNPKLGIGGIELP